MTAGKFPTSEKDARNFTETDHLNQFPDANVIFEEPMSKFKPGQPLLEKNYWPMKHWTPVCGIVETDKELVLQFELPEVKKEDVKITVQNSTLTLRGVRKFEEQSDPEKYLSLDRQYGEFTRSFNVPIFVDAAKINAEFARGLLTVKLPKLEEAKAKQLDVKVN